MAKERIADFGFRIRGNRKTYCGFSFSVDVDRDAGGNVEVDVNFEVEDGETPESGGESTSR